MKNFNKDMYILLKNSLLGKTIEEKLEDVENRIFMNDMIDRWTAEDYEYSEVLHRIKEELESEINAKQN